MSPKRSRFVSFLKRLMLRQQLKPSQLAAKLSVSHVTVGRWLSGVDIPNTHSCKKLTDYSSMPIQKILAFAGHLPREVEESVADWPEFREYAQ